MRLLGGRATLSQHLTAVLLSAAPLVLLLPSYIPDLSPVIPITFAFSITLFSRIIALIGFAWAALILIKGLSLAHEISWVRATVTVLLGWLALYVLLPLTGVLKAVSFCASRFKFSKQPACLTAACSGEWASTWWRIECGCSRTVDPADGD